MIKIAVHFSPAFAQGSRVPRVLTEGEGCKVLTLLVSLSPRTTSPSHAPPPTVTTATAGWSSSTPSVKKRYL